MASAGTPSAAVAAVEVSDDSQNEEDLRNQLRQALESIKKREPIDPSYKSLLMSGAVTSRRPVLSKDKFYKPIGSRLRERVEKFMEMTQGKDPFDRMLQRQPLEQAAMRAAFTLREAKEHEQATMLAATLASLPRRNGMDDQTRKRHLESVAVGLQSKGGKKKKSPNTTTQTPISALEQSELARQKAELERQRAAAREREEARKRREEQERRRREEEILRQRNKIETPQQAVQKVIQPIFKVLWDMEFANLGGQNPFRIVIDRKNYIDMQVPDYFDVIETPMNLTYIQDKVNNLQYENLPSFFQDVELMLNNALKYNNDTSNPYHVAANEMKRKFLKIRKKVISTLQQKHQAQNK